MIIGVGTDIVSVSRFTDFWARHGERGLEKILAPEERDACRSAGEPGRFLAKRFAAKEALGKAFGTGIRAPLVLPAIAVIHDELGKPAFHCSEDIDALFKDRGISMHLSISDERDYALAFVVLESR